jgi:SAM-dependent methyltransferase
VEATGFNLTGVGERYHAVRPQPPAALVDLICRFAKTERPALVVDVGCGTGLSSFLWCDRADRVVGIEPNAAMRRVADAAHPAAVNIEFRDATADTTGVPRGSADVVTFAQSFHYAEPNRTLAEVARVLRVGGVFAAYDYDWPPTIDRGIQRAFAEYGDRVAELLEQSPTPQFQEWPMDAHLEVMSASGRFSAVRERRLRSHDGGDGRRLLAIERTTGPYMRLRAAGFEEAEFGFARLQEAVLAALPEVRPWVWAYRVRLGLV